MLPREWRRDGLFSWRTDSKIDQGQGGGQAIEDGAALGALLSHIQSLDDVPKRLQLFEQVRKKRGSAMQMFSNAGQEEAEKIEKDAQPFVDGAVPRE